MPERTVSEMLGGGAIAVEADIVGVRHDYFSWDRHDWPVTLLDLAVVSIAGVPEVEPVALLLPGGPERDGGWLSIAGTPELAVGERVLLLGTVDGDGILRLTTFFRSVFRRRVEDEAAVSSLRAPIADADCGRAPVVATAGTRQTDDGPAAPLDAATIAWTSFVAAVGACVPAPGEEAR